MIQNEGYELAQELKQDLVTALQSIDGSIQALKDQHPGLNPQAGSGDTAFKISQMSKDGIEIIQEIGIEYNDWEECNKDSNWTIRTLKLWFFLQKDFLVANKWAAWPDLFDQSAFMDKACEQIEDVIDDFHQYLLDSEQTLVCEDAETMLRAECMIKHLGGFE